MAIIPARGGSKGIPGKNIVDVAGRPLIAWTIEAAARSSLVDRCVVSTDDERIADVSRGFGAEVLMRPAELATDEASTLSVLTHVARRLPCETVVLLQATSPIRRAGLIDECIREFEEGGYDSLATGLRCKYVAYGENVLRRQEIEGFFYDDGNVYVMRGDMVRRGERFGERICRKVVSRWENVEIDDRFDLWVAERIIEEFGAGLERMPEDLRIVEA
ncbi:MAG TPA: acylneuraminate cytidylyltransferase family protein [Deltaproteobacteria bacterium]|nr:acylneuraminate cytidylyltransferase family protein [Deltaproteobacteria bacterium]